MNPPSGAQFVLEHGDQVAVVTGTGATLRHYSRGGHDLIAGFEDDAMCSGGRGQVLAPWPNRIRDGRYTFAGQDLQLPLTEPGRHNASHGLVRWTTWLRLRSAPGSVRTAYRLAAQPGYPWSLHLEMQHALDDDGLTVTVRATNLAATPAPFAFGAHPYLTAGSDVVDGDVLTLPGATRLLTDDERKLPTGREDVAGTAYDFRGGRALGDAVLDHAYTDLDRDDDGRVRVRLAGPERTVELWGDEAFRWVQVYTADDQPASARRALAVEPTTAPPDAFRSGDDLLVLEPGERFEARWGIREVR